MLFIDGEQVHDICAWDALMDALQAAHEGPYPQVSGIWMSDDATGHNQVYGTISAWLPGEMLCTKLVTVFSENPYKPEPLPGVQALVTVFDGDTGTPLAVIDGTAETYRKTAGDSALGCRLLARPDSRVMTMAGAGGLAPYVITAHMAARPSIERVNVWNRTPHRAETVAKSLQEEGIDAHATEDLETAVRQSDIISCATNATEPLVLGKWLKPGAHLDLIGAYTTEMRECDDEAVSKARLFVDTREIAGNSGDLASPIARGVISAEEIEADLYELCQAKVRFNRAADDITLFKNGGGAHLDLFTARFILRSLNTRS